MNKKQIIGSLLIYVAGILIGENCDNLLVDAVFNTASMAGLLVGMYLIEKAN